MEYKSLIRDCLADLLWKLSLTNPSRNRNSNCYIVTFHRVLPENLLNHYPLKGLVVTPAELEWFIINFKKYFDCMSLSKGWTSFIKQKTRLRPILVITFDDGQVDNYIYASPILDRHGVKGTFFIPYIGIDRQQMLWHDRMSYAIQNMLNNNIKSDLLLQVGLINNDIRRCIRNAKKWSHIKRESWLIKAEETVALKKPDWDGFMSWDNLKDLIIKGHEIGCHSFSHPMLDDCDKTDLKREIVSSKKLLESKLEADVISFSYPNGNYSKDVLNMVENAGYKVAVTTEWGSNTIKDHPLLLKRHDMTSEHSKNRKGILTFSRVAMRMANLKR